MAATQAPTAGEYVVHHLGHLTNTGKPQTAIIDFSIINFDTVFWSVLLGALAVFLMARVARHATAGVPGRFQAMVEILVEMVENQSKSIVHGDRTFIAPLALTVFVWIFFLNAMDLLPVDLPHFVFIATGLDQYIQYHRIVATADLNGALGMALGVFVLMIYYNLKIKGVGGFLHELFVRPLGRILRSGLPILASTSLSFWPKPCRWACDSLETCMPASSFSFSSPFLAARPLPLASLGT